MSDSCFLSTYYMRLVMEYPNVKTCLDTSEDNLVSDLYQPCLHWAERFDRGVGYFTTGWINYNVTGLSYFASRG